MDFKNENRHMVDVLFVLTLFFVFALSAITLVILGANVYHHTVDNMSSQYSYRTSYSYVTNKLRQNDEAGTLSIGKIGSCDACIMKEEINGTIYNTYIYGYDGSLCELLTRADMDCSPSDGTKIMDLDALSIEHLGKNLYKFDMTADGNETRVYLCCHSEEGGSANE